MAWQAALAFLFLAALAGVVVAKIAIELRRQPLTPVQNLLWWASQWVTRLWWRTSLPNESVLPDGGAVLICNHRSSVDPIFMQVLCRRVIHWMVAREFCEHPAFAWLLRILEVIPVRRGGVDTAATKQAIRLVADGGLIGMFPEGRINMTSAFMLPSRPGAVMVAIKARARSSPAMSKVRLTTKRLGVRCSCRLACDCASGPLSTWMRTSIRTSRETN